MTATAATRRPGGLIDRRLAARAAVTRRYLVTAVVVGLVGTATVVVQAALLGSVIADVVLHRAPLGALGGRLGGLAAAFAVRAVCLWVGESAAQRTSATVTSTLRRQLLRHALALGPGWLAGERAGELSLAATRGVAALDVYYGRYLPQAVLAALAPAGILAWVGWADWPSLLILLGLVALVPVAMVVLGRESAARTSRQWRRMSALSARYLDLVRGLPTLRAFGREAHGRREVAASTESLGQATMSTLRVAFLSALALEFLAGIGVGLVAMVLGLRLLSGAVPLSSALAVLLVSPEVFLPLRRAGAEFHASAEGQAAAERILSILETSPPAAGGHRPGPAAVPAQGSIELRGVTVRYPGRSEPALDGVDLAVGVGEHVAVVGPSGSGKSTVLALVLGFAVPDAGCVLAGGVDLRAADLAAWRRAVAWVPQRPHLVHGTLGDNLGLADPAVGPARLAEVAEAVGLDTLLRGLPRGLDTPVGEGGVQLSAGERQRVALGRALVRDAPVVLLDEPVAHLDPVAEAALAERLGPWLGPRTVVVAAHRPELVTTIDRVVTLGSPTPQPCDADDLAEMER